MRLDRPILDLWSRHRVRAEIDGVVHEFEISGYSFAFFPDAWRVGGTSSMIALDVPATGGVDMVRGRNKWLNLAAELFDRGAETGGGSRRVSMIALDGRIALSGAIFRDGAVADYLPTRSAPMTAPQFMGSGYYEDLLYPAASWQPETPSWSAEPSAASTSYRVTRSPYNARSESRMVWGHRATIDLVCELVPAADVWSRRAADLDAGGWAAMASRVPAHGMLSTLDAVWPYLAAATPQSAYPWTGPEHGTPAILWLDTDALGESPMRPLAGDTQDAIDDRGFIHCTLDEGVSVEGVTTPALQPNRKYTVRLPLNDVTPQGLGGRVIRRP